jgi:hypothetical protein
MLVGLAGLVMTTCEADAVAAIHEPVGERMIGPGFTGMSVTNSS